MIESEATVIARRNFLKGAALGSVALTSAAGALLGNFDSGGLGVAHARAQGSRHKMAFIQWQPHAVPAAWSKGIEEALKPRQMIDYELLDGQNKVEAQASLKDALISKGASVIFLQPIDFVALAPSIAKAKRAGVAVITLNIDATETHAAHVEMNHYLGAMDIARTMDEATGGKGTAAILNAPPGNIVGDQGTNGFVDGVKKHHPQIEVVADQVADWDRRKAQDVLHTILAAHADLGGVYGVNYSMALGAVDVAKERGLIGKLVIFRQRRRGRGARVVRGRRAHGRALHRRQPAGAPCRRRGDRRRPGEGVLPSRSSSNALCHRQKKERGRDPALPTLVSSCRSSLTHVRPVTARTATAALILFFVATIAAFGVIAPRFATAADAENLMSGFSFAATLAMGQAFPIPVRGIDLFIGAIVGVVGMVVFDMALILHAPGYLILPVAIVVGTLAGAINGVLIVFLKLQPFIATLAAYRGFIYAISGRQRFHGHAERSGDLEGARAGFARAVDGRADRLARRLGGRQTSRDNTAAQIPGRRGRLHQPCSRRGVCGPQQLTICNVVGLFS